MKSNYSPSTQQELLDSVKNLKFENSSDEDALRIILNPSHVITDIDYKLFEGWLRRSVNNICPKFDFDTHGENQS